MEIEAHLPAVAIGLNACCAITSSMDMGPGTYVPTQGRRIEMTRGEKVDFNST